MQTNDKFILKELGDFCDTMMIHKSVLSGSKKRSGLKMDEKATCLKTNTERPSESQ